MSGTWQTNVRDVSASPRESEAFWNYRAEAPEEWRANAWGSEESADRRYIVGLNLAEDAGPYDTLVDYGCGTGALKRWVDGMTRPPRYIGIDRNAAMIERAKREHPDADFHHDTLGGQADLFPKGLGDVVVALGTFNLRPYTEADLRRYIRALWNASRRCLVVSCLRIVPGREGVDRHHDSHLRVQPDTLARMAAVHTPFWTVDCSYSPGDVMVALYRR